MKSLSYKLSPKEYILFRDMVLERTGLFFGPKKRTELEETLLSAFAKSPSTSLRDYYNFLRHNPESAPHMEQLINSLTVGETHFFRNKAQFGVLKEHILPEIIASKRGNSRQIRIWSAGCATGEEPYSLAILLKELLPDIADWNILIMATDINREYLARAIEGVYGEWAFRGVTPEIRRRYFYKKHKSYRIFKNIKQMVTFAPLNLIQDTYPCLSNNLFAMDLILCRNVTIYLHQDLVQGVVEKFYHTLLCNGWLIVGHSEPSIQTYQCFKSLNFPGTVIYKKVNKELVNSQPEWGMLPVTPKGASSGASSSPPVVSDCLPDQRLPGSLQPSSVKPAPKTAATCCPKDPYQEGVRLLKAGRLEQALIKLEEMISLDPDFIEAYRMITKIYADRGQLDTALDWCQQALKVNKLAPRMYYILALILMQKNLYTEAKEALRKLLYLDQGFVMGYLLLAQIYQKQGQERMAWQCLANSKNLLQAIPDDEPIPEAEGTTAKGLRQALAQMHIVDLSGVNGYEKTQANTT